MLGRRPASAEGSVPSHEYPLSSDPASSLPDSGSSDMFSADSDMLSEDRTNDDGEGRHRPLSPGSIDVLGTLLSVAAAATAASLFSPSLGFQGNGDSNASPPSGIPRPLSPTPTAGLGGGEGFSSLPGFGLDPTTSPSQPMPPPQPREGRERIRTVWESFRERLGLNRNPSSSDTNEDTLPSSEEQGNMRPGEIMLAEMARALNIGLGLNGDGSSTTPERPSDPAPATDNDELARRSTDNAPTGRPLPPEDSFERFLLNLQADLRTALSDGGTTGSATAAGASDSGEGHSDPTDLDSDAESARLPASDDLPMRVTDEQQSDDEELPPLEDVSDSEDEDEEIYEDTESTRTPTPMPASSTVPPNLVDQSSPRTRTRRHRGNADRAPPGINLWRLYRFQPIPASQVAGHAAATTSTSLPLSPSIPTSSIPLAPDPLQSPTVGSPPEAFASLATPPNAGASASTSADPVDTTSAATSSPPAGDASQNMVVPVIVVGLQSVDMGQVHGHAHPPESDAVLSDSRDAHTDRRSRPASASFDDAQRQQPFAQPLDGSSSGTSTPRGRGSWQSRAATALRNLRPGRRNGSRGRRAAEGTGSRTFLIYVIGGEFCIIPLARAPAKQRALPGYYPPNHHMVTGSDNLDSYEALWELAELLGQVKPPVATREDIENSGLQIIKSSELEDYEREGKLASNCVERCLICLDDYDADDELRLMTCKHAFHKQCVDRWLQVGRNNCPACRTKVCTIHALPLCRTRV
ncbi:hypothetical protein L227DRAFT_511280 [Lentinus tigrinus ALCF2SS1-6]|uniref:RING-type E3 ubiquitin transferase n=1 Tax=Lentinus tigrinus ALCF2SS1-6 TaxID=1328759 RepID=A0A5C2RTY4_9APHY|nr:hypothetical protein L227DRAFT_511280 [Lentinus tigrinus ALCF2SS1-6]